MRGWSEEKNGKWRQWRDAEELRGWMEGDGKGGILKEPHTAC